MYLLPHFLLNHLPKEITRINHFWLIVMLVVGITGSFNGMAQHRWLAFEHVTVIDMKIPEPRRNQTVLIEDERIIAVGPTGKVRVPKQAQVIHAKGKFLIPGLWDAHVHITKAGPNSLPLFIANGITSVRDMGGDPEMLLDWREKIESGKLLGPRIKTPGPILEDEANVARMLQEGTVEPVSHTRVAIGSVDNAIRKVDSLSRLGVDFLKIRTVTSKAVYEAIASEARKKGLALTGHAVVGPEEMLLAGQRSIEHAFLPPLISTMIKTERAELFHRMAKQNMVVVPTLITGKSIQVPYKQAASLVNDQSGRLDYRRRYVSGYLIEDWREQVAELTQYPAGLDTLLAGRVKDLREMHRAGVRLMAGTDVGVLLIYPGFSLHQELILMVKEIGLTPYEALQSATIYPAEFFNLQNDLGTIETGKRADLLLLGADPLRNISNTQKIMGVVANGSYFSKSAIQELLNNVKSKSKLKR